MKTFLILLLSVCLVASTQAQAPVAQGATPLLTADKLDQLLGPLALYPDSLIALILPASTEPANIALAARYLSDNGDPAQIPNQPWDDSVKSLTRYPNVLQWLNQNLDWTTQLGDAFLSQPADVMDAIQQLRAQAKAAGHLMDTAQQQVIVDNGDISIEPTDPNTIYVPEYDPDTIYEDGDYADTDTFITFGLGFPIGAWLNYDMDWHHHGVYVGDWRTGSDYRGRGGAAGGNANLTNARPWHPDPNSVRREGRIADRGTRAVSTPKPLPGVTIPHGSRTAGNSKGRASNASNSPRSQGRDFTGRGEISAPVVAAPSERSAPAVLSHSPTPPGSLFNDYRRGSDALQSSNRGRLSRQPSVAPAINRPAPASFSPAAPERSAPAAARPAPAASAFHVSAVPAARASSSRGAQSRGRR
jgi:hypothetical protein